MPAPRLVLADDHELMCEGLRALLEPEFDVVGVVHRGEDVLAAVEGLRPDVLLLDISLPGKSGLEVARELTRSHPELKILMLTMHAGTLWVDESLRAGARGFVGKQAGGEELRRAVSEVLAGRVYISPRMAFDARTTDTIPLTPRQLEVLRLVARGWPTAEIARQLGVTPKAVEFHRARIRQALGLSSNAALVRYAVSKGII